MESNIDIQCIIESLTTFLQSSDNTASVPPALNIILDNINYIQNQTISIFLAKSLRHIKSTNIHFNVVDDTRTSLPPSIYFGIVHPSSAIRQFSHNLLSEKHPKKSFQNLGDYTNIIQPLIQSITQNLNFVNYTSDIQHFDLLEHGTNIANYNTNHTNDAVDIHYVESHLYSGLKLLIDTLSDDIINNHIVTSNTDLWNILFSKIHVNNNEQKAVDNEKKHIIAQCCGILLRILRSDNHYLLWEHHNLLIPNINLFIHKMCDLFMCSFQLQIESKKAKEVIYCLEAAVESKSYNRSKEDIRLMHRVIESLLIHCWNTYKVPKQIGPFILNTAFRIIRHFLSDDDENKQHTIYSNMQHWSKICVDFAIAGNIDDDESEQQEVRQRLKLYPISYAHVKELQMTDTKNMLQSLQMDTKNVLHIIQTYLFGTAFSRAHGIKVACYHLLNDNNVYQNNCLWIELLSRDIDPWNFPASIHKLMFEMYLRIAPWDHFEAYHHVNNVKNSAYCAVYHKWVAYLETYFDIVAQNCELAMGIFASNSVLQYLIASYILSGNEGIKCKMNKMIQAALNYEEQDADTGSAAVIINRALDGCDLKLILRHFIMNQQQFLRLFDENENNEANQVKQYNKFVYAIVDGVLSAMQIFEDKLQIILQIPALLKDNPRVALQYFFAVKEHIVSMIANAFSFIDYFRSADIKWDARKNKNRKLYQCFSEIIFSSSKQFRTMIDYVLIHNDGVFGCSSGELVKNKYFDENEARVRDLVHIFSFLANHWIKYIEALVDNHSTFDYKRIFDWFKLLKYPKIGKQWIHLMSIITENNPFIEERFDNFIKEKGNKHDMIQILQQYFDIVSIKMHQDSCTRSKCCSYHLLDRENLSDLVNIDDSDKKHNSGIRCYDKSSLMPLKKKLKKTKQFKITEYYTSSSSPSASCTPAGSPDHTKDEPEHLSDDKSSTKSLTPKPRTFMGLPNKNMIKRPIQAFKILDKQLFATDNKLMYFVDYSDAAKNGPDWKYRREIIAEFGDAGRQVVDKWNDENKDTEVETMWGVSRILAKRKNESTAQIEYKVLWDTPNEDETSWESIDNLETCKLSIQEFECEAKRRSNKKRKDPPSKNDFGEPVQKKRKLRNHQSNSNARDNDDDINSDTNDGNEDGVDSDSLEEFMIGHYSEGEEEYFPERDKTSPTKSPTLNPPKKKKQLDVSLKLLDITSNDQSNKSDETTDSDDFPISANHLNYKNKKKHKNQQKDKPDLISNRLLHNNRKRNRENGDDYSNIHRKKKARLSVENHNKKNTTIPKHNDLSSHLNEMMGNSYAFSSNRAYGKKRAPSGDIIPKSTVSKSFKQTVKSNSFRQSKLGKLRRDHQNSILAGNISAKLSNAHQFRKNDRSKPGNFRKNKGAVILPVSARTRTQNIPKIPKIPKKITRKLKQKLPIRHRQSSFDNTLFKTQHKKQNPRQHMHRNMNNGNMNYNNIQGANFKECHVELFGKILNWKPNHVQSASNETQIDLAPMGDEYESAQQYKILFEPFLLEEVRAQTAQTIEEKKASRLIKREIQDISAQQRNKNHSHRYNKHQMLYDTTQIIGYQYQPRHNLSTLTLQSCKQQRARLNKTYYNNDLVLLTQDNELTKQNPRNMLKIGDIINSCILGIVKKNNDSQQVELYINAQNPSYRAKGNLCAVIYLHSLITACREYRCLSTMVQNIWAKFIIKPKNILPVDGVTLQDIKTTQLPKWMLNKLNDQQLNAISAALCHGNNITLIKGPPGTGKTTTIVSLINAVLLCCGWLRKRARPKILVCAPSNAAIDTVIERTYRNMKTQSGEKLNVKMMRIGSGATQGTVASKIQIDRLLREQDPHFREEQKQNEFKTVLKEKEELTKKWKRSRKLLQNNGASDEEKKREKYLAGKLRDIQLRKSKLEEQIKKRGANISHVKNRISKSALTKQQDVVFGTLSASASPFLNSIQFDLLIIDEATQACELSQLIPFQLNIGSIVLVGDEKQLAATVISNQCETFGYSCSYFERCIRNKVDPYLLTMQYRMHPEIRKWPSIKFYENKLRDGPNINNVVVPFVQRHEKDPRLGPYAFFDIYQHQEECATGKTYANKAELDFILRLLDYMSKKFYERNKNEWHNNVGVVTPYRGQVALFRRHLKLHKNKLLHSVVADTVECFQGQEKDIMIFSCVRSQREAATNIERANLGFLTDLRRLNVALTRAKLCCFIVGNSSTLKANKAWKHLISDAHNRGCIYKVAMKDHKKWLNRTSAEFVSTLQEMQKRTNKSSVSKTKPAAVKRSHAAMDIDDSSSAKSSSVNSNSSSHSRKSSSSSSKSRNHRKANANTRYRNESRHNHNYKHNKSRNNYGKHKKHRLSNAEIAKILNLPEPPSDPRRRR